MGVRLASTSADEVNDLDDVAGRDRLLGMAGARDDRPVHLDRHRPLVETEMLDQGANGEALGHLAHGPVDRDLHRPHGLHQFSARRHLQDQAVPGGLGAAPERVLAVGARLRDALGR